MGTRYVWYTAAEDGGTTCAPIPQARRRRRYLVARADGQMVATSSCGPDVWLFPLPTSFVLRQRSIASPRTPATSEFRANRNAPGSSPSETRDR